MERLTLNRSQAAQIIAQARACAPQEACGVLGGSGGRVLRVYPLTNTLHSPSRYEADGDELWAAFEDMAGRGWEPEPLAIYHSHPRGPETPSETDVSLAYYPASIYLIIAHLDRPEPSLRGFRIVEGRVSPVQLEIAAG
jgi:proteasome lid subunit RPN8/RPN11